MKYSYDKNPNIFPTNKKINILDDLIRKTRKEYEERLKELQLEKDRIQLKCDHEYHLTASGMYDDHYECKFCGHETMR